MSKMWTLYIEYCRMPQMWWPRNRSSTAEILSTGQIRRVSQKSQEKRSPQIKLGLHYSSCKHFDFYHYTFFSTIVLVSRMMSILNRMLVLPRLYCPKTGIEFDSSSQVSWRYLAGLRNPMGLEILWFVHLQQTL